LYLQADSSKCPSNSENIIKYHDIWQVVVPLYKIPMLYNYSLSAAQVVHFSVRWKYGLEWWELIHSLTHSLMELSPSWEATNCAATQELPAFYGTQMFITVFTRALHWSLSWAISIQSTPSHPISLRSSWRFKPFQICSSNFNLKKARFRY
jgi:hypothetical protein